MIPGLKLNTSFSTYTNLVSKFENKDINRKLNTKVKLKT